MDSKDYRVESDSIGQVKVPVKAYYGVNAVRAAENFKITGNIIHEELIIGLAEVKKACAISNFEAGIMAEDIAHAIAKASDEIIEGKFHEHFIVDPIQGGAGTSANMNANEVIANRANEILGGSLGSYDRVHPNDHVNMSQSTNDAFPTAGKIAALRLGEKTVEELEALYDSLLDKAKEFDGIIKMGRTHLQDAVPIRLGQEFHAYSSVIKRDISRISSALDGLRTVNMGASAVGTGINVDRKYFKIIIPNLNKVNNLKLVQAEDLVDGTNNLDGFVFLSAALKTAAVNLSKIANDMRLMASGPRCGLGELNLPAKQAGSSIMPGKINPVIAEVMSQVAFNIIGNDTTVTMAAEAGQLELNVFEPVLVYNLYESLQILANGVATFRDNLIKGITANEARCKCLVDGSVGTITTIVPYVGYENAAKIAKLALETGIPVKEILFKEGLLTEDEIEEIIDCYAMTEPGIAAKHLLDK
jgi:aspartate ammonia-lyase